MPNRRVRIGERTEAVRPRIAALRAEFRDSPMLLTTPGSVNWITGGLSDPVDITASSDPLWIVEASSGRAIIASEIEAPRLRSDFDVEGLGWQVITVPWFDAGAPLAAATSFAGQSSTNFVSDLEGIGSNISTDLVKERMILTSPERDDLRALGALAAHALEVGIDAWRPGLTTDYDIAAAVSAELERHGAKAVCLIVGGDERLRSVRHPLAVGQVINDAVMAVVVARRAGLHVAATRTAVRRADDPIVELVAELDSVNRSVLDATRVGATWGAAVTALAAGYESIGRAGSWREHFQGGPIAFEQREFELAPGQVASPFWNVACAAGSAVAWNPSLRGGAKIEETYLVGDDSLELVTVTGDWPLTPLGDGPQRGEVRVIG